MAAGIETELKGEAPLLGVSSSLTGKLWRLRASPEAEVSRIAREQRIDDVLARLIAARGIGADEAARFLAPRLKDYFPDPSSFADMDKAAALLWDALEAKRRIAVFADYDVDGAASSALLWRYLKHFGIDAAIRIPDRITEGYGPNPAAMRELAADGVRCVLLGGPDDAGLTSVIARSVATAGGAPVIDLAGVTNLRESYAVLQRAAALVTNDSAPMHLGVAAGIPVIAIYCSTVPEFGFAPRGERDEVVEVSGLECRPCGIHGHPTCPEKHFRCGWDTDAASVLERVQKRLPGR